MSARFGHSDTYVVGRIAKWRGSCSQRGAFESAFDAIRLSFINGFPKVAVIVKTLAGKLQAERHAKRDGLRMAVFTDVEEARAYCSYLW